MATKVKLKLGEVIQLFDINHANRIMQIQVKRKTPKEACYELADDRFELIDGVIKHAGKRNIGADKKTKKP